MDYTSFDYYMKQRFGGKVYRLSLSTGCTCPNRDGRCGSGGCIFCSAGGSGEFAAKTDTGRSGSSDDIRADSNGLISHKQITDSINLQIETAKTKVASKLSRSFAGYMAYFQSFTNTYFRDDKEFAGVKARFFAAARHPEIVAIAIATRPDALPGYVLDMLSDLNRIKPVIVELGLQTVHDDTSRLINRGYATKVYDKAVRDLHAIGIGVVTHMIIGLPGETEDMMADTIRHIVSTCADPVCDGTVRSLSAGQCNVGSADRSFDTTPVNSAISDSCRCGSVSDPVKHSDENLLNVDSGSGVSVISPVNSVGTSPCHSTSAGSGPAAVIDTDLKITSMPDGIKIQLLQVLKGTRLEEMVRNKDVALHEYSPEEYAALLRRLLPLIPKKMVVHRLTGDPPKNLLISPLWTADKKRVLNYLHKALKD